MRSTQFGNWENREAFDVIQELFNEGNVDCSIYTLRDIYHITLKNFGRTYEVSTESGFIVPITSFEQLKKLLKNELITIIETNDNVLWEDKHFKNTHMLTNELKRHSFEPYKHPMSQDVGMCQICFDPLKNRQKVSVVEQCGHMFHTNCAKDHIRLRGTCPVCRQTVNSFKKVAVQKIPSLLLFGMKKGVSRKTIKSTYFKKPPPPPIPGKNKASYIQRLKQYIRKYKYTIGTTTLVALLAILKGYSNKKQKNSTSETKPSTSETKPSTSEKTPSTSSETTPSTSSETTPSTSSVTKPSTSEPEIESHPIDNDLTKFYTLFNKIQSSSKITDIPSIKSIQSKHDKLTNLLKSIKSKPEQNKIDKKGYNDLIYLIKSEILNLEIVIKQSQGKHQFGLKKQRKNKKLKLKLKLLYKDLKKLKI